MTHYPTVWIETEDLRRAMHAFVLEEGAKKLASKRRNSRTRRFIHVPVWVDGVRTDKEWYVITVKLDPLGNVAELYPVQAEHVLVATYDPDEKYDNDRVIPGMSKLERGY